MKQVNGVMFNTGVLALYKNAFINIYLLKLCISFTIILWLAIERVCSDYCKPAVCNIFIILSFFQKSRHQQRATGAAENNQRIGLTSPVPAAVNNAPWQ